MGEVADLVSCMVFKYIIIGCALTSSLFTV